MTFHAIRLLVVASVAVPGLLTVAGPAGAASQTPVVSSVTPVSGSTVGNTRVVIAGTGFSSGTSVIIGGTKAIQVDVLSSHRLAAWAPPHGHGVKDVVVRTSHGTSAVTRASRYTYLHATIPGRWTSARAALPSGAGRYDDLRLVDTSCPSVSTCYSVGRIADDYTGGGAEPPTYGTRPIIRSRSGSSYSLMNAPLPADADRAEQSRAEIDAIDCPAVGSCAAVGSYPAVDTSAPTGYVNRVLLLSLASGTWHAQAAPTGSVVTATDDISLEEPPEVSCGAVGNCVAGVFVDGASTKSGAAGVLYRLAGGSWAGARPVVPSGAQAYGVLHVSCPAATYCAAALDGYPNTYLDVSTGGAWSPVTIKASAGMSQRSYRPDVLDLACVAVQQCTAMINSVVGTVSSTHFLRLVSGAQSQYSVPTPGDAAPKHQPSGYQAATDSFTSTLACPAASTCFATNVYYAKHGSSEAAQWVVARLAGGTVHVYVMPEPTVSGSNRTTLRNLACPTTTSCVAVGRRGGRDPAAAYVSFADGVWTSGSLPTVANQPTPSQGQFVDLDCTAVGQCFADADYAFDPQYGDNDYQSYTRFTDLDAVLAPG